MKILFVQKMNGVSGSELYMMQIMPELKRRGYEIEMLIVYPVVGDKNAEYINYLASHGIPTHEIYGHAAYSPLLLWKIGSLIRKKQYDIVQSNLIHADFWMATAKILFKRNQKLISVKHGYYPKYQAKYGLDLTHVKGNAYYWIARYASRIANFNVTISKGLYKVFVEGEIAPASKTRNIYYGLTLTDKSIEGQLPAAVKTGEPFVLITGRLVSFKGHPYLIEAWKKVYAKHPELKLYIAGDGNCRTELEKLVAEAGLEKNIIFLGHVPNPHPLFAGSLFTIVSSVWEGFGLILLESWLHKKPIVAFDVSAMNEVIDHEKNGLLVKEKNSDDLADKINYLYENPQLIEKYGEDGYQKLHSYYTLQRMCDDMEQVYKAIDSNQPVPLAG